MPTRNSRTGPVLNYIVSSVALQTASIGTMLWVYLDMYLVGFGLASLGFVMVGSMLTSTIRSWNTRPDRDRGSGPNRTEPRPYQDLSDEVLKSEYVEAVLQAREAESGGIHLSPTINKGSLLRQEWRERGNEIDTLSQALEEAGYETAEAVLGSEPPINRSETPNTSNHE